MEKRSWLSLSDAKTCLVYSRYGGMPIGDSEANLVARSLKELSLSVSTENVIHAFRLLIKQGFFAPDEVAVFFEKTSDEFIPVVFDKDGRTFDWYEGFCDTNDKVLQGILGWDDSPIIPPEGERFG